MAVVLQREAIHADRALAHGVEVAKGLLVFGADAVAALDVADLKTRQILHQSKQVEIFRQRVRGLLEGGAVVGALVRFQLTEAFGAEGVAARQNSRTSKRLLGVPFQTE